MTEPSGMTQPTQQAGWSWTSCGDDPSADLDRAQTEDSVLHSPLRCRRCENNLQMEPALSLHNPAEHAGTSRTRQHRSFSAETNVEKDVLQSKRGKRGERRRAAAFPPRRLHNGLIMHYSLHFSSYSIPSHWNEARHSEQRRIQTSIFSETSRQVHRG